MTCGGELSTVAFRSEDDKCSAWLKLLLLMDELAGSPIALDRLTCYDFLAENPYLLFAETEPRSSPAAACWLRRRSSFLLVARTALHHPTGASRGRLGAPRGLRLVEGTVVDQTISYRIAREGSRLCLDCSQCMRTAIASLLGWSTTACVVLATRAYMQRFEIY